MTARKAESAPPRYPDRDPAGDPVEAALTARPPDDDCLDMLAAVFGYGRPLRPAAEQDRRAS